MADALDAVLHQAGMIDRYMWSVTGVGASEQAPSFAYTVGLTALGRPELLIAGLGFETMHGLLNRLAGRVVDRDESYTHGQVVADLIRGYEAVIVAGAELPSMPLGTAKRRYGAAAVRVLQVVWPDREGRFPWDGWLLPAGVQPVIGRP